MIFGLDDNPPGDEADGEDHRLTRFEAVPMDGDRAVGGAKR
jgi:hypothetical protein